MSIDKYGFFSVCSNTGENCPGVTGVCLVVGGLLVVVVVGFLLVVVVILVVVVLRVVVEGAI